MLNFRNGLLSTRVYNSSNLACMCTHLNIAFITNLALIVDSEDAGNVSGLKSKAAFFLNLLLQTLSKRPYQLEMTRQVAGYEVSRSDSAQISTWTND